MFGALAKALFGSENERILKRLQKTVEAINALEPKISTLDDTALAGKTDIFRQRLADEGIPRRHSAGGLRDRA